MTKLVTSFDALAFEEQADRLHADLRRAQLRVLNRAAGRVLEGFQLSMEDHLDALKSRRLSKDSSSSAPGRPRLQRRRYPSVRAVDIAAIRRGDHELYGLSRLIAIAETMGLGFSLELAA
jgi:hypothetical protein